MPLEVFTYFCSACHAVIEVTPTNVNARLNLVCRGQDMDSDIPVIVGDHDPTPMRQISRRPL